MIYDTDLNFVYKSFKQVIPGLTYTQARVFKLLWGVSLTIKQIKEQTGLSQAGIYSILHTLGMYGLIHKDWGSPKGFSAVEPAKSYKKLARKMQTKIDNQIDKVAEIEKIAIQQAPETYILTYKGNKQRITIKGKKGNLKDANTLREILYAVEQQRKELEKKKLSIAAYARARMQNAKKHLEEKNN